MFVIFIDSFVCCIKSSIDNKKYHDLYFHESNFIFNKLQQYKFKKKNCQIFAGFNFHL